MSKDQNAEAAAWAEVLCWAARVQARVQGQPTPAWARRAS